MKTLAPYKKTIVAVIGGIAAWGVTASADGLYTQTEVWGALVAALTAAGVYQVRNSVVQEETADTVEEG